MVALAVVLPLFAILPWKRGRLGARDAAACGRGSRWRWRSARWSWALQTGRSMLAPVGSALAAWLVLGPRLAGRVRLRRRPDRATLRRAGNLPRADWGKALAHAGLGRRSSSASPRSPPGPSRTSAPPGSARASRSPATIYASTASTGEGPNYPTDTAPTMHRAAGRARDRDAVPREAPLRRAAHAAPPRPRSTAVPAATSTWRSATRRRTAAGRSAPTSSPSPTGSGLGALIMALGGVLSA